MYCPPYVFSLRFLQRDSTLSYPSLPGEVKAAHVKPIVAFLAAKAYELCDNTVYDKVRAVCAWSYCDWQYTLDCGGLVMQAADRQRAVRSAKLFLVSYQWLAVAAFDAGRCQYKVRCKHHFFGHTARRLESCAWNPKGQQCILEEDFLGKVKRIAARTARKTMPARVLDRYIIYLHLRWERRRRAGTWCVPGL